MTSTAATVQDYMNKLPEDKKDGIDAVVSYFWSEKNE